HLSPSTSIICLATACSASSCALILEALHVAEREAFTTGPRAKREKAGNTRLGGDYHRGHDPRGAWIKVARSGVARSGRALRHVDVVQRLGGGADAQGGVAARGLCVGLAHTRGPARLRRGNAAECAAESAGCDQCPTSV